MEEGTGEIGGVCGEHVTGGDQLAVDLESFVSETR